MSEENRRKASDIYHLVKYMESTPGIDTIEKALDEKDSMRKSERKELFEEAMAEFSKIANIVLKGLAPFKYHGQMGTCSNLCLSCRVKNVYWDVSNSTTEIKSCRTRRK